MRKKILSCILMCLIIVSFSINVFSVDENQETNSTAENKTLEEQQKELNTKIDESNTKLEYVQGEMGETLKKVEELNDSITDYEAQYSDLENKITTLENQIKNGSAQIQEIQEEYDRKEKILKRRTVALYEAGETTYLDFLLTSKSIVEFLSNYYIISEIIEYDNNLLEELDYKKTKLEEAKQKQEEQEKELRVAKNKINSTNILLNNTKILKENYMLKLTDEEKTLQEQIAQYKEEQADLERKILASINWTGTMSIKFTGGVMVWPIAMEGTYITSGYGNRLHPIQGVYKNHAGIDISGSNVNGTPVVAAADGVVTYAGWIGGYGNCIIINHGSGIVSLYGHGSETVATVGQVVKQGDIIMKVGSTGNSTGPHVHFEIRKNGEVVDPIPYLNGEITNIDEENTNNEIANSE
ncbi:MAG: murein hydrolase activator EnvC family protein [Christensenellales bacterium]